MKIAAISPLVMMLASLTSIYAQNVPFVYDDEHNKTSLVGTWSTGSRAVTTGAAFANPANMSFTYPKVTGQSVSFSEDNWFEFSRYRFLSNASEPNCIKGVVLWFHGRVTFNTNGSLTLTPAGDGFQQVQDPCAPVSNFIEPYNNTELMANWRIFQDLTDGFKLHLFQYDGAPLAPMFQVSTTPVMLPKRVLRNDTVDASSLRKRDLNGAVSARGVTSFGAVAGISSLIALML